MTGVKLRRLFTGVTFSSNASSGLQVQSNDNSIVGDGVGSSCDQYRDRKRLYVLNNAGNTAMDIDQGNRVSAVESGPVWSTAFRRKAQMLTMAA